MGEYIFSVQMLLWASPREQVIGACSYSPRERAWEQGHRGTCVVLLSPHWLPLCFFLSKQPGKGRRGAQSSRTQRGSEGRAAQERTVRGQEVEHVIKYRMDSAGLNRNALPSPAAALPVSPSLSHLLSKQNL